MVPGVEGIEQDGVDRLSRPQAQRVDTLATPADGRCVIGGRDDALALLPDITRFAIRSFDRLYRTAEADFVGTLTAFEFPGIAVGSQLSGSSTCQPSAIC